MADHVSVSSLKDIKTEACCTKPDFVASKVSLRRVFFSLKVVDWLLLLITMVTSTTLLWTGASLILGKRSQTENRPISREQSK